MTTGRQIAALARDWKGTPYHHQASLKGIGCDCLGLCRGVYREAIGDEPERMPNYSPSWDEVAKTDLMLRAFKQYLRERKIDRRGAGLVLVFRMRRGVAAKHCGIMTDATNFVHSYTGRGVIETKLDGWWESKIVGVFAFPGVRC